MGVIGASLGAVSLSGWVRCGVGNSRMVGVGVLEGCGWLWLADPARTGLSSSVRWLVSWQGGRLVSSGNAAGPFGSPCGDCVGAGGVARQAHWGEGARQCEPQL